MSPPGSEQPPDTVLSVSHGPSSQPFAKEYYLISNRAAVHLTNEIDCLGHLSQPQGTQILFSIASASDTTQEQTPEPKANLSQYV
jgi:hypothetical protein